MDSKLQFWKTGLNFGWYLHPKICNIYPSGFSKLKITLCTTSHWDMNNKCKNIFYFHWIMSSSLRVCVCDGISEVCCRAVCMCVRSSLWSERGHHQTTKVNLFTFFVLHGEVLMRTDVCVCVCLPLCTLETSFWRWESQWGRGATRECLLQPHSCGIFWVIVDETC